MANQTLFQFFHWYYQEEQLLWNKCKAETENLKNNGITYLWLPPAYKGNAGGYSVGYDPYDLFDLGEFDQKGTVPTKYGSKEEYLNCIKAAQNAGLNVIADVVLNHRAGGDEKEKFNAYKVNKQNRNEKLGEPMEIEAYTKFNFPGRDGKYSTFVWDFHSFSGVDYAENIDEDAIFKIINEYGDNWEEGVSQEMGNFDFLLGADIEYRNPNVREQTKYWAKWYLELTKVSGFRFDAIKHIPVHFIKELLDYIDNICSSGFVIIGEYWTQGLENLTNYLDEIGKKFHLFDSILHYQFSEASKTYENYDLRKIFDGTLTAAVPLASITFVENHDTQPMQSLESPVSDWFKPIAYALILLRESGFPCIFYPDFYGAKYKEQDQDITITPVKELPALLKARSENAYGAQADYFDDPNFIGWTRMGEEENHHSGCAVMISNKDDGGKIRMKVNQWHADKTFINVLNKDQKVETDDEGCGEFFVEGKGVALWLPQE